MQRNLRIHLANVLLLIVVANSNTSLVGWLDGWMDGEGGGGRFMAIRGWGVDQNMVLSKD